MPYKDARKQKAAMRRLYKKRYGGDVAFAEAEKARKAAWYQANRERLIQKVLDKRAGK